MLKITDKRKHIEDVYPNVSLIMSSDENWNTLLDHINSYTHLLEAELGHTPLYVEAVFSYYENITVPLFNEPDHYRFRFASSHKPTGELYLERSAHVIEMMKEKKDIFGVAAVTADNEVPAKNLIKKYFMKKPAKRRFSAA